MTEQAPTTTTSQPDRKPRIRPLGGARYLVESFTRPGLGHQVDVLRLKCGCEAGSYNRRCRHLVLALEFDAWRRREEAKARAASRGTAAEAPAPVQAANWSSTPAAVAPPVPVAAAVARPVETGTAALARPVETGMRALQECFE